MRLSRFLATALLATTLANPSNAQTPPVQDYTETEKVITAVVNNLIRKPTLEQIEQRSIQKEKVPFEKFIEGSPFTYPEIPIYQQSATKEQYVFLRNERLLLFHLFLDNKIELLISTENSEALEAKRRKIISEYQITNPEAIRINGTETKIYFLHPKQLEIKKITQKAVYSSGKEDILEPLEESLKKTLFMYGGEKLVVNTLKAMKLQNAQDYINKIREKYITREQTVMSQFAEEINQNYQATKIPLYPSRTFGEKEVARFLTIELKDREKPFAIYVRPAFGNYDTGFGRLEILLRSD